MYTSLETQHVILADEELVELYRSSQQGRYFDALYDRYVNKVFAKCIGMLKDRAMAEDATQEIFMKILLNISNFKGTAKFSTWIYSITYNYCIDYLRKQKKKRIVSDESQIADEMIEEVSDKELLEIKIERLEVVLNAAEPKDRAILMMKYNDQMSIKEMAATLSRSESAIKMSILRAKHRVKKIYKNLYHE